jgi:hypothetical protein
MTTATRSRVDIDTDPFLRSNEFIDRIVRVEGEDAKLTGMTRSRERRLLGLNLPMPAPLRRTQLVRLWNHKPSHAEQVKIA